MLPILGEIEQAAIGCWSIIRGSEAGARRFDLSIDGFWRSFRWAFVLAVFDALSVQARAAGGEQDLASSSTIWLLFVSTGASLITFFIFPLIVGALARPMHLTKGYPTYIVVRNWLMVFLRCPVYVVDALGSLGVLPEELRDPVVVALVVVTLFSGTVIARALLGVSRSVAFGFAFLDFLLALLIGGAASRLVS